MLGWKVQKVQNKTKKKSASKEFRKKVKYLFCYIQDTVLLCLWECTVLFYGVHKGPAYWNVMSSIFGAQMSSLPCYVGGKGLEVGGSMAHCLSDAANYESEKAKSNKRQTMTQHWRRQRFKEHAPAGATPALEGLSVRGCLILSLQ